MALRKDYTAGEPLPAVDVNDIVTALLQNSDNIFELTLENYFIGKLTPVEGLIFDGFSDLLKADTVEAQPTTNYTAGDTVLPVPDPSIFTAGNEVAIYDENNIEEKVVDSITIGDNQDQLQNTRNTDVVKWSCSGGSPSTFWGAMDFTPSSTDKLSKIKLWARLAVSQTGNDFFSWTLEIHGDNAGEPDGTPIASANGLADESVGTNDEVLFDYADDDVTLNAGTKYWLVLKGNSCGNGGSSWHQTGASSGLGYTVLHSTDSGATWNSGNPSGSTDAVNGAWYFELLLGIPSLNLANPLDNSYTQGANLRVARTVEADATIDTTNKQLEFRASGNPDPPAVVYYALRTDFQSNKETVSVFLTRSRTTYYNLKSSIAQSATSLVVTGDVTSEFANGDTIDIYDADNEVRERKTINATPTYDGGADETTITFTTGISNAGGFDANAFVERVDSLPYISVVDKNANESFQSLTYVESVVDFDNDEVEDEYSYTAGTPETSVSVKLKLTRNDNTIFPFVRKYGAIINN